MSLIRQIWLLLLCTLLLAFGGSEAIYVGATRGLLETELRLKNGEDAVALAHAAARAPADAGSRRALLASRFDTGLYGLISFRGSGRDESEQVLLRQTQPSTRHAPAWFATLIPITSEPGTASVLQDERLVGSIEMARRTDDALRDLWHGSLRFAIGLAALGVVAGGLAALGVRRIRQPLGATVAQAEALERGDYLTVAEPAVPELQRLTRAMNSMVGRLRSVFEAQTAQVEALRRQASCDPLTGISNRAHFLAQLGAALGREDASAASGMVLLRVLRLIEMNRVLGRKEVDRLLIAVGQTLQVYAAHVRGAFLGRLNGSDFALVLPEGGIAAESAEALVNVLRAELPIFYPRTAVVAGAVEVRRDSHVTELLADADMALARAESAGPFSVVSAGVPGNEAWAGIGERGWHERVWQALTAGRVQLGEFPVFAESGALIHLECPLRLQLVAGGRYEPATNWLPFATRSRLNAAIDERGLALALDACSDGVSRSVNISPASLLDTGFAARLRDRLRTMPRAARLVWLEVAEPADDEQFESMREFARQIRPTGARFGIEHAGERLSRMERLIDAGIDYVKLDAAITRGVATDPDRASFAAGLVAMLHSLSLQVFGEGIVDEGDAARLWACGIDGLTGPWISAQIAPAQM